MELQKALESDGWINQTGSPAKMGAWLVLGRCGAAGVGWDLTTGGTLKQIPAVESVPL